MTTWLPGAEIPNYQFFHPAAGKPITIHNNSTTIRDNMPVSDILTPNQGCVNWAACTEYLDIEWNN
ncbi:hypothetical protein [Hahella ganghwensis]|uniref:hypothetical protein n=1 Tax=Hahella ganghwensis TaxID=286420 RepID=UPI0005269C76